MAEHLDTVFDVEQPLFRRRQEVAARKEVPGYGLRMTVAERPARMKRLTEVIAGRILP